MKLLLINPPYPFEESPSPPFGLISLAAYLRENGVDVKILDYIISPLEVGALEKELDIFAPDIVGATGVTMNVNKAISILAHVKRHRPSAITVMGGPHATFDAEALLGGRAHLDYIVRGEGEITALELINSLGKGNEESVAGLSFRRGGMIIHNPDRPFINDINILPKPARDLVELAKYRALGLPINMVTSRGCPFECVFCVGSKMVGRKVRYFSVDRVVDEFEMLSRMGFRQINIVDDLFTSHKERCMKICDGILSKNINHEWTAFARVDTVTPELLAKMREAGCTTLCFGIESGNQKILDTVKKKTSLDMCRKAIAMCSDAGISPMTSYILGLPGETHETVRETMEFAKALSPSYGYHILAPFPGTEVREKAAEFGMRILTSDWDLYDANRSVAESVTMPADKVDRVVNEFNGGIRRYVDRVIDKYEKGDDLAPDERSMINNIRSLDFASNMIYKNFLDEFGTAFADEDSLIKSLAEFVASKTKFDLETSRREIGRLYSLKCIENIKSGGAYAVQWAAG